MIGIDLETTGLDPQKDQARFVQIVTEQAVHIADAFTIRHEKIRALVRKCAARGLVAHNTVFEYRWLTEYFEVDPGRNVSGALRPGRGLGRAPAHPSRHGKWSGPQLTDEQIEYAEKDAEVLPKLY